MRGPLKALPAFLCAIGCVVAAAEVSGQDSSSDALAKIIATQQAMQEQLDAIQRQLAELAKRPPIFVAPAPIAPREPARNFAPSGMELAHVKGSAQAKLVLIVFADFECPFCGEFARDTLREIEPIYVSSGKVQLAFRHRPIPGAHPNALPAAAAAECAGEQGKFWEMHDALYLDQRRLSDAALFERAERLALNRAAFAKCLNDQGPKRVAEDVRIADSMDINSTPTVIVGRLRPDGKVDGLEKIVGLRNAVSLASILERHLALVGISLPSATPR
jgi:protein-disulfide isomerase